VYSGCFYEYHKQFSLKCATVLQLRQTKVDWSKIDRDLLFMVTSGANACGKCGEVTHQTKFCVHASSESVFQGLPQTRGTLLLLLSQGLQKTGTVDPGNFSTTGKFAIISTRINHAPRHSALTCMSAYNAMLKYTMPVNANLQAALRPQSLSDSV
jgi:hypothetical protein